MKLLYKVIVIFTFIIMAIGIFQYIFLQKVVQTEFDQFLMNQEMGSIIKLKNYFENYYATYQSFDRVENVLSANKMMRGNHANMMGLPYMNNAQVMIADQTGTIIADSMQMYVGDQAKNLSGIHKELQYNNEKIGELIVIRKNDVQQTKLVEQFVQSTNATILISSLLGSMITVLASFFITKGMTKPVTQLLKGIEKVASGDTSYRVHLKQKDEFYPLSQAFNHMAEQLSKNEEFRKNLMADVAHELRTPLAIIRGKLESIQEGVIQADEKEIMILIDEVYRLSRLVNDLQQLSLAEAGKLPLHKQPININVFLEKVVSNFRALTEEKGIRLIYEQPENNIILSIDEDRMTQVIVNFLDNAQRHTPSDGQITITLEEHQKDEEIIIKIADTGEGIEKELLSTIFDRFSRTDSSRNRGKGGTGLGLAIAKGFVEAHGGHITVTSEIGKGTTFFIHLNTSH